MGPIDHAPAAVWGVPARARPATGRARDVSAVVILQKKCDCVDEILNIYSRSFRINFATESIIDATGLLLSIVNATALGATFGVFFEKRFYRQRVALIR